MIEALQRVLFPLILALWAVPALAHLTPNSEIRLNFAPGAVTADVIVPQAEFAYATGLATDNRPQSLAMAKARVLAGLAVTSASGKPWRVQVDRIAFEQIAGPPDMHLSLTLIPPAGADDRVLRWSWRVVTAQVPSHFALLVVDGDLAGGLKGEQELVGALTADRPTLIVNRGQASAIGLLGNAFTLGAHHIAEGYDHLLFLLALLLPAPLLAAGGRWQGQRSGRDTVKALAWIVSAFTIGHSATLILGAFFHLSLPAQPVEAGIAFSVLVSAMHAARPLFPGREPMVAALFGLVHGMAFATLVSNFGLGASTRALAILGFNLGIEAVQLCVVLIATPLLIALARWRHGDAVRIALAGLTGIAALVWLVERLGLS